MTNQSNTCLTFQLKLRHGIVLLGLVLLISIFGLLSTVRESLLNEKHLVEEADRPTHIVSHTLDHNHLTPVDHVRQNSSSDTTDNNEESTNTNSRGDDNNSSGNTTASASVSACLQSTPLPFVLITSGRSGSSVVYRMITKFSGEQTPYKELPSFNGPGSRRFFRSIADDDVSWMYDHLCMRQQKFPNATLIGFKWKPFSESFYMNASVTALSSIAHSENPKIRVVRLQRNQLDVYLSRNKHKIAAANHTTIHAHCIPDTLVYKECMSEHALFGTGMTINTTDLVKNVRDWIKNEDDADRLLDRQGVAYVKVTYENLFDDDNSAEEWMKIFRFLGVGPTEGLTQARVTEVMNDGLDSKTSESSHNVSIANFKEVRKALQGEDLGHLLHRR